MDGSRKQCPCAPNLVKPVSRLLIRDSYVNHVIAAHVQFPRDKLVLAVYYKSRRGKELVDE